MSGSVTEISWLSLLFIIPYLFLAARIWQGLARIKPSSAPSATSVRVSLIIPTANPPSKIQGLLSDLALQNYSHDSFEVIVADDTGGSWEDYPARTDLPGFRVVPSHGSGKKSAIDTAIMEASGEIVITTDDDCRVGSNWILAIASHYNRFRPGMIICPVELEGGSSLFNAFQHLEFFSLQGATAGSAALGDALMCNGAGLAFRRELYPGLENLPGNKIPSGDDVFFLHYLKRKGIAVEWIESESAIVRTEPAGTISEFFRQRSRWASKSLYYNDASTIFSGVSVLLASVVIAAYIVMSFFDPLYIRTAIMLMLVKSIPDSVIIMNRLRFHGRTDLIWYFPLVQILYPFYVVTSVVMGLSGSVRWD